MISDVQSRKILEDDEVDYTDEEIRLIKEFLYQMAAVVIEINEVKVNEVKINGKS